MGLRGCTYGTLLGDGGGKGNVTYMGERVAFWAVFKWGMWETLEIGDYGDDIKIFMARVSLQRCCAGKVGKGGIFISVGFVFSGPFPCFFSPSSSEDFTFLASCKSAETD